MKPFIRLRGIDQRREQAWFISFIALEGFLELTIYTLFLETVDTPIQRLCAKPEGAVQNSCKGPRRVPQSLQNLVNVSRF